MNPLFLGIQQQYSSTVFTEVIYTTEISALEKLLQNTRCICGSKECNIDFSWSFSAWITLLARDTKLMQSNVKSYRVGHGCDPRTAAAMHEHVAPADGSAGIP